MSDSIAIPTRAGVEGLLAGPRTLVEYSDGSADLVIYMSADEVAHLRRLALIPQSGGDAPPTEGPRSRRARELGLRVHTPET